VKNRDARGKKAPKKSTTSFLTVCKYKTSRHLGVIAQLLSQAGQPNKIADLKEALKKITPFCTPFAIPRQ
jgi:hypothetical protein